MKTAKIFTNGNSQAVRLPREFQFDVPEVHIYKRGNEVVLIKKQQDLTRAFELLTELSDDFMTSGREQPEIQKREPF